jgi:hypothetical protein
MGAADNSSSQSSVEKSNNAAAGGPAASGQELSTQEDYEADFGTFELQVGSMLRMQVPPECLVA